MQEHDPVFLTAFDRYALGQRRVINVPNPAPGADWRLSVPGGRQWRVCSAVGTLTTGAVVANRFVGGIATDGNATIFRLTPVSAQPATAVSRYCFLPSCAMMLNNGQSTDNPVPLMQGWYPAGYTFGAATVGLDVGDQWTLVNVAIEEFFADDPELSAERLNAIDAFLSVARGIARA